MFISFRMGPAASGKIDTVFFGVSKSPVKIGKLLRNENIPILIQTEKTSY